MKNYCELNCDQKKIAPKLEIRALFVYVVHKYIKSRLFNVTKTVNLHKKDSP